MSATAQRRAQCATCLRPQTACICHWVTPTQLQTEVLILQHPLEVTHAKNTGRLLHLSLTNSRLLVGESFDATQLHQAFAQPKYTVLLYPPTDYVGHKPPAPLETTLPSDPCQVRVVVLDGTWRKSRKMLHLSPLLQCLPRLSLSNVPASGYSIRKAHKPGQLSTLEATCAALAQIEGEPERFQPLLDAFHRFVSQQLMFISKNGL